jgi:hypothetical protein
MRRTLELPPLLTGAQDFLAGRQAQFFSKNFHFGGNPMVVSVHQTPSCR